MWVARGHQRAAQMPTYAPVWQIFPTPLGGKTHISNSDRLADDVGVGLAGRLLSASDWQAFSANPSPPPGRS